MNISFPLPVLFNQTKRSSNYVQHLFFVNDYNVVEDDTDVDDDYNVGDYHLWINKI